MIEFDNHMIELDFATVVPLFSVLDNGVHKYRA